MSTLEAELLAAADDTEALAREWGGRIAPTLDARAAGYRARAARVRELEATMRDGPCVGDCYHVGCKLWNELCGPLNPGSAGGAAPTTESK